VDRFIANFCDQYRNPNNSGQHLNLQCGVYDSTSLSRVHIIRCNCSHPKLQSFTLYLKFLPLHTFRGDLLNCQFVREKWSPELPGTAWWVYVETFRKVMWSPSCCGFEISCNAQLGSEGKGDGLELGTKEWGFEQRLRFNWFISNKHIKNVGSNNILRFNCSIDLELKN